MFRRCFSCSMICFGKFVDGHRGDNWLSRHERDDEVWLQDTLLIPFRTSFGDKSDDDFFLFSSFYYAPSAFFTASWMPYLFLSNSVIIIFTP